MGHSKRPKPGTGNDVGIIQDVRNLTDDVGDTDKIESENNIYKRDGPYVSGTWSRVDN